MRVTVEELIKTLQTFPLNIPVVAEWDNGWSNLDTPTLEKDSEDDWVLVFDVHEYGTFDE